jgi:hypothetical protein
MRPPTAPTAAAPVAEVSSAAASPPRDVGTSDRRATGSRLDAQAVLERLDDVGTGDELGDRGQVGERVEAELLQERGVVPNRIACPGPVAGDLVMYPACLERAQHTVGVDAADLATWAREIGCL